MRNQQAFVAAQRAADRLMRDLAALLKSHGVSPAQYNVLRIIRGARPGVLSCSEVAARMINHAPDMTRLFDRLDGMGLIERSRLTDDRRVVRVTVTGQGLKLLAGLDSPVRALHEKQFGPLGEDKTNRLIELLTELIALQG